MSDYRAAMREASEALELWMAGGCFQCGGDCASANPPVACCPVRASYDALASIKRALQKEPVSCENGVNLDFVDEIREQNPYLISQG